jgi:hypothetical protein
MYSIVIRQIQQHIRQNYKNIKGKTNRTKEEAPFTILFKPALIICTSRNNEILKCINW